MLIFRQHRFILLFLALWLVGCKDKGQKAPEKFYDEYQAKQVAKLYKVKAGDTLSSIAHSHGHSYVEIARWNNIDPPYRIIAGHELTLFESPYAKKHVSPFDKVPSPSPSKQTLKPSLVNKVQSPLAPQKKPKLTPIRKMQPQLESIPQLPLVSPSEYNQIVNYDSYIVKKGDTLYSIGRNFKVDHYLVMTTNNIVSPSQLYAGQKLKIPNIKQKHSAIKIAKNEFTVTKNLQNISQKTSIISNNNENMLKFYCQWPVGGKILKSFSKTGGRGVEISGRVGQQVKAVAAGEIVAVNTGLYGHGKFVVIKHKNRYITSYSNNRRTFVKRGQKVKQGQVIAEMGQIGYKVPRLIFEVRKDGKLINPIRFLPKR